MEKGHKKSCENSTIEVENRVEKGRNGSKKRQKGDQDPQLVPLALKTKYSRLKSRGVPQKSRKIGGKGL